MPAPSSGACSPSPSGMPSATQLLERAGTDRQRPFGLQPGQERPHER